MRSFGKFQDAIAGLPKYSTDGASSTYHYYDHSLRKRSTFPTYQAFTNAIASLPSGSVYTYTGSDIGGLSLLTGQQHREIYDLCASTGKKFYAIPGG